MRHRQFSNSFTRSGIDQHDSNHTPVEQSYFSPAGRAVAPENGPFVGQMNHMSRGGVHSGSHRNLESRGNEYPSSNVSMEVQPFVPNFSGSSVDPYLHSSISENRSLAPVPPVGQVHCTNYNVPSIHDVEAGLSNCTTGNVGPPKRKRSDMTGSCERGSSSSFYSAGSSSSSSQMPREKPAVDCQSVPPYRGSLTIAGEEDSPRNVRRRYRLDLEPSMTRTNVPSHSSHFYQSMAHPANYSAPVQHANLDANGGQWNSAPRYAASSHRRISPSDTSGLRHEMNQFHIGGSSSDVGACHRDPVFSRHPVSTSQNLHSPHAPSHVNHSQRVQSTYGNGSRYSHYPHGGTSSTNGVRTLPENFSSRNSRHCSPGGWRSSYRSGRPRIAVERFQSVLDITESHNRMGQETMMMESFNGNSRNTSDQYRDLRLDIDSMSYEELLNLEERIGNVSTGLSEDSMSKCLKEKVYYCCSDQDQNHEEDSCPICLEEYKNGDKVGRMEKCGHDYHVGCIKKWLLMKKLCPICKTEYSNQEANP
ncbi:E3 ubiquitin-protein ligase MBR1-like isoform X1 [Cynara cardunculus var. scolymus]|uniref:E3 ubiquitin-protein ligase MBR1-like isoform X1 n=1 Tax=Cynara cardunculus var. scolymus TaxID=59895 RepID=UPI000D623DFF|nr:E3 ubiquitin-protein ligase MBR1-like isoform X1 [Cynara cardunculus var. scolymus]XP_024969592.1 E3 ubiquitin-protein ligase MBR1-like isoform X1 [Cynara cardunculus var. scolymus]XP_024969598.1 E3 ubiquitin-protein ligase MBR1-like isoform X1 [Cynara cardunculus var. scolymus]XP_024969603.1 E3 ubiquitin-protein ligase MBR1-like isoform X1 [Cynara cardunculus var. scolymus]XP_024969607.1 E3 ubiquitin-protein ligase MBR1-like isoform X1 [Cynara cardunculus var. scolymus]XP_024969611.1 E3 ub